MVKFGWDKLKRFLAQANTWSGVQTLVSAVLNTGVSGTAIATTAEAVAGTLTDHITTPSGVSAALAVQTNPKAPSQAVAVTAGATASITNADNGNLDMDTGNFALIWRGSLPDWTPSAISYLLAKYTPTTGFILYIDTAGKINTNINNADHLSSVATGIPDGTFAEIVAVYTRGTSVVYYVNGYALGTAVAQSGTATVTNAVSLYNLGKQDGSARSAGICSFAALLNFAPTAAEVLDLYRNGIPESWKWGSQTSLITGNDSTFAGASNWANVDINAYDETTGGVLTVTANAAGQYCTLPIANATTVIGKKYRLTYTVASIAATWTVTDFTGTGQTIGTVSANGTNSIEFTAATTGGLRLVSVANNSSGVFDNMLLYEIGATLALEPEGVKIPKWYDSSTNALDASYPATGSSLTRSYQPGTESLLSITNVSLAANADTTLYTVPTGRRLILTKALLIAGADAGATSALSIGADATETDFIPAAVLSNLDAANDVVLLQPVPVAALPVKNKSYAAGTVIQAQVATQSGGATNSLQLYGVLY